jgi:hypothetical protein
MVAAGPRKRRRREYLYPFSLFFIKLCGTKKNNIKVQKRIISLGRLYVQRSSEGIAYVVITPQTTKRHIRMGIRM